MRAITYLHGDNLMTTKTQKEQPEKVQNLINELEDNFNGEIREIKRTNLEDNPQSFQFIDLTLECDKVVLTNKLEGEIKWIQPHKNKDLTLEYKDTEGIMWDITLNGVVTT